MSLTDKTRAALDALSTGGPHQLDLTDQGQHLVCCLSTVDALACSFDSLELTTAALADEDLQSLKQISEKLAARLTYLLEPIRPVEIDGDQCVIQMRSLPPDREADRTSYYELLVQRGGKLRLVRWLKTRGQPRQTQSVIVTRDVFLRLVKDMSQASCL